MRIKGKSPQAESMDAGTKLFPGIEIKNSILFVALLLLTGAKCLAEDLSINGTTYKNVTITRTEPDGIAFSHSDGLTKIKFFDLSKSDLEFLLKKYHLTFDKESAENFSARQKEANDKIKEQIDSLKKENEQTPAPEVAKPVQDATPNSIAPEKLEKINKLKQEIKNLREKINDLHNDVNQRGWKSASRHGYKFKAPHIGGEDRRITMLKEKIEKAKEEIRRLGGNATFD